MTRKARITVLAASALVLATAILMVTGGDYQSVYVARKITLLTPMARIDVDDWNSPPTYMIATTRIGPREIEIGYAYVNDGDGELRGWPCDQRGTESSRIPEPKHGTDIKTLAGVIERRAVIIHRLGSEAPYAGLPRCR